MTILVENAAVSVNNEVSNIRKTTSRFHLDAVGWVERTREAHHSLHNLVGLASTLGLRYADWYDQFGKLFFNRY